VEGGTSEVPPSTSEVPPKNRKEFYYGSNKFVFLETLVEVTPETTSSERFIHPGICSYFAFVNVYTHL